VTRSSRHREVRAMQMIDDLEATRRGQYGGGIGHVSI
jgi:anthranilate/para-aminobenzoate synthase component I